MWQKMTLPHPCNIRLSVSGYLVFHSRKHFAPMHHQLLMNSPMVKKYKSIWVVVVFDGKIIWFQVLSQIVLQSMTNIPDNRKTYFLYLNR